MHLPSASLHGKFVAFLHTVFANEAQWSRDLVVIKCKLNSHM